MPSRAFISYSSADSQIVERIVSGLNIANYNLDKETFEFGITNAAAITKAMRDCDIFVLVLSKNSIASHAVTFETLMAQEAYLSGLLRKILIVCVDEHSFDQVPENLKRLNIARAIESPESISRKIQFALVSSFGLGQSAESPFVNRNSERDSLQRAFANPSAAHPVLYLSGSPGIGRRRLARHFLKDTLPYLAPNSPEVNIGRSFGIREIFRELVSKSSPAIAKAKLRDYWLGFDIASYEEQLRITSTVLDRISKSREYVIFFDDGGMTEDSGALNASIIDLLKKLPPDNRSVIVLIGNRMVPRLQRDMHVNISYHSVDAFSERDVQNLLAIILRESDVEFDEEQAVRLAELCDGHPYNVAHLVTAVRRIGVPAFLSNTSDFFQWKKDRASAFLSNIEFSEKERKVLWILSQFRELNFDIIHSCVGSDAALVLESLLDKHVLQLSGEFFLISKPMLIAVERDARIRIDKTAENEVYEIVRAAFSKLSENGLASFSVVDAAILSDLYLDGAVSDGFSAFLIPSHFLWLADKEYQRKNYERALSFSRKAVEGRARLTEPATHFACRILCLASTRLRRADAFDFGIKILQGLQNTPLRRRNYAFLLGFRDRFEGKVSDAEKSFLKAYQEDTQDPSVVRELASLYLAKGDFSQAEHFARTALAYAPDNAFHLDILIRSLVRSRQSHAKNRQEIEVLLERLHELSENNQRTFFETRQSEYLLAKGDRVGAKKYIDIAHKRTPNLFDVRITRARVYLEIGEVSVVRDEIAAMKGLQAKFLPSDGFSHAWQLLSVEVDLALDLKLYDDARSLVQGAHYLSPDERIKRLKEIDTVQAYNLK